MGVIDKRPAGHSLLVEIVIDVKKIKRILAENGFTKTPDSQCTNFIMELCHELLDLYDHRLTREGV